MIQGTHIKGLRLEGVTTFNSIPGLMEWNETDFEVELSGSDIVRIGDRSSNGNRIEGASAPRRAQLVTVSGFPVMQNSGNTKWSVLLNASQKGWNNIIQQKPFGIFTLFSRNNAGAGYIIKNKGNEPGKFWFNVNSSGAVRHTFRNASNSETSWGSANSLVSLNNTFYAVDLLCYGTSNNPVMEMFLNTTSVATITTSNIAGTETASDTACNVLETDNSSALYQLVMLVVYNWDGYTKTQIDSFRASINQIREAKYGTLF